MDTDKVHWISIVNSLLIVTFLTGMIALILTRSDLPCLTYELLIYSLSFQQF